MRCGRMINVFVLVFVSGQFYMATICKCLDDFRNYSGK